MELFFKLFEQFIFWVVLITAIFLLNRRIQFIKKSINLGRDIDSKSKPKGRLKNMFLMAFGQKKMFDKPLVALLHLSIYLGFFIINIEVLEIILDGIFGTHRLFFNLLDGWYNIFISCFEVLAFGVLVTCIIFLIRRNILKIGRFEKIEMKGWPRLDANLILIFEICLVMALLKMNAADTVLQLRMDSEFISSHYPRTGTFLISQVLTPFYEIYSTEILILLERITWWFHILGILGFAFYITYSKHLHIALSFISTYYYDSLPKYKIINMPSVTTEVHALLEDKEPEIEEELPMMGAQDIRDLYKKNILDAFACSECGRCTENCPANLTGKKLSPRKIMMDVRDRAETLILSKSSKKVHHKPLYQGYISKEELMACTTCNACVEVCPLDLNPLNIIVSLRRYVAMEESGTPLAWNMMFQNIENNANPWGINASNREEWIE